MMSILFLFLLGGASSRTISFYDNGTVDRPIISKIQEHRICAELCMVGLGGEPCGEDCLDLIPQGLPLRPESQSGGDKQQSNHTRRDACPILCDNKLGYPLCDCDYTQVATTPFFRVDFLQICNDFCVRYKYQIYGCDECSTYTMSSNSTFGIMPIKGGVSRRNLDVDWNSWCVEMCQDGNGGAACYCDLLPLSLKV